MPSRVIQRFAQLELEEKILNGASLLAVVATFFPWVSGEWLGMERVSYSGFSFYTSYMGISAFLLHSFILLTTVVPLTGGPPVVKKKHKDRARLYSAAAASILILSSLTVLSRFTAEFTRIDIRFGIIMALVGSLVSTLYAYLRIQEQNRKEVKELFHHPDEEEVVPVQQAEEEVSLPPPPAPPPAPAVEDHKRYSHINS